MGESGQPLETFGKGFKGKPGDLGMAGPDSTQLWWLQGDKQQREKTWGIVPERGGMRPSPRGLGDSRHLERGWGRGLAQIPGELSPHVVKPKHTKITQKSLKSGENPHRDEPQVPGECGFPDPVPGSRDGVSLQRSGLGQGRSPRALPAPA